MKKKALKLMVFLVITVMVLSGVNSVLRFKYIDGIHSVETFYRLPENTVDVLVLGSSHAFEGIDPAVLWREAGIVAYDLGGAFQQIWNTYYYLAEALKTQSPKLIVLDLFACRMSVDYDEYATTVKNTFGLQPSKEKWDNFAASFRPEDLMSYVIEPVAYHGRYADLSRADFLPHLGNPVYGPSWKGFVMNPQISPFGQPEELGNSNPAALSGKVEEYYRKILALAEEQEIPLVAMVIPYADYNDYYGGKYLGAGMIAEEYGAEFIDFNTMPELLELDYGTDMADGNHLNHRGSRKLSTYLAEYLRDEYDLPDLRGDPRYTSWEENAEMMQHEMTNATLREVNDLQAYLSIIFSSQGLAILVTQEGEAMDLQTFFTPYGMEVPEGGALAIVEGEAVYQDKAERLLFYDEWGSGDIAIKRTSLQEPISVLFDRKEMRKVNNGVNLLVYNLFTDSFVDAVGFDAKSGYGAVR